MQKARSDFDTGIFDLRLRDRCAFFWLTVLFQLTAIAPAVVKRLRPVFIRLAYSCSTKIRRNTKANAIRLGIPEDISRSFGLCVVGSFYDFVCDIGKSIGQSKSQLASRVHSIEGADGYLAARAHRRGAVLITAHMGSFEAGLAALPIAEKKVHVVFKRDRVGGFEKLRRSLRDQLNVAEAPIDDGIGIWMRLREALLNDEVVAVQGDRIMPGQKGMRVKVLSGTLELPTGPFKLALSADSPVIPIFSFRGLDRLLRIFIGEPIHVTADIDAAVKTFSIMLENQLRKYPDQWLVLDAAFCEDRSPV